MTREEYLAQIQNFSVFQTLDSETQKSILQAKGAQMERFIDILTKAQNAVDQNRENFFEKCHEIFSSFKLNIKKVKTDKRHRDETNSTQEDTKAEEKLLEQLAQL